MNNFIKITILVLLLGTTLFSKSVGTITAYASKAFIVRDNAKQEITLGMQLQEKDKILTEKSSKVQIIFNDETIITIGKNSEFSIEEYLFEEDQEPNLQFGLIQGAMRTITGKIGKIAPQKFKVKTKTATIGIRGTNFTVIQKESGEGNIYCTFGAISVDVNGFESIVKQGFYVRIFGKNVEVKPFSPKELKALQKENFADKKSKQESKNTHAFSKNRLHSDRQIDTTKESIRIDVVTKKIANNVKDAKQISDSDKEEHIHTDPNQNPDDENDDKEDVIIDPANTITFSKQMGKAVVNTKFVDTTMSHIYLDYELEDKTASKMNYYLISSNGEYELWSLYIDKPTSPQSKENYTTRISSATIDNVHNTDNASSNPRVSSGTFKAIDDDLVSGDSIVWGEWESSLLYDNNNGANQTHNIGGLWVAGERTDQAVVDALTGSEISYVGIYKAIDYENIALIRGKASMIVDFGNDTAVLTIDYSNGRVYDLSYDANSGALTGYQNGDDYGYADAFFYGSDASLIGGNFSTTKGGYDKIELKGIYELAKAHDAQEVTSSIARTGWLIDYTTANYANHLGYNISSEDMSVASNSYLAINRMESREGYNDYWELRFANEPSVYTSAEDFELGFDSVYMVPASGSSSKNAKVTSGVLKATPDDLSNGDYMSWGYWNASLTYDDTEGQQSHELSGYWQSGENTPVSVVEAITASDVRYEGRYRAVDLTTQNNDSIVGNASLNVDFGADRATLNIGYENGRVFDMTITNNTISGSEHAGEGESYGSFYGPNAESVGGNFTTIKEGADELRGVYQVTK